MTKSRSVARTQQHANSGSHQNSTIATAIAIALGAAPGVHAQQPATAVGLEEVIVTASRRSTTVQDIPYNISAYSGDQLETAGITDLSSIARLVPGLQSANVGERAASTNSNFIIRGLNTNRPDYAFIAPNVAVPLVSTYIDEVPLFTNLHLGDIQRVEVLRGPQGTLYGSGSVGGTVRVIHNSPRTDRTEFEVKTRGERTAYSDATSYGIDAVYNLPLSDNLAWRTSAGYENTAGFIDGTRAVRYDQSGQPILADPANPLTSGYTTQFIRDVDTSNSWYVRSALAWKPNERLNAELAYHHEHDESKSMQAQTPGDPKYTVSTPVPIQPIDRTVDMASLTVTGDVGFATLTSTTSWYKNAYTDSWDQSAFEYYFARAPYYYGGYPRATAINYDNSWDRSYVQELRLVSKTSGAWDWIAGVFYQNQKQYITDPGTLPGFAAWSELPGSAAQAEAYYGIPTGTYKNLADFLVNYNGSLRPSSLTPTDLFYNFTRNLDFTETALYGEATYKITPAWQVTGGARVFWQHSSQNVVNFLPICASNCAQPGSPPGYNVASGEQSFQDQIFKFNSSYRFNLDMTAYLTIAQGYRHGGANALCAAPNGSPTCYSYAEAAALLPYKSDTAVNYELGLKGFALNHRMQYSAGVFLIDWSDIQLETFSPVTFTTLLLNGKTARSQGVEAEVTAQATRNLTVTFGYAYNDSKLTQTFVANSFVGRDGDRLPSVARNTASLGVDYIQPAGGLRSLHYHADAAYQSDVTTLVNNCNVTDTTTGAYECPVPVGPDERTNNFAVLSGFTTLNASVALEINPHWEVRAYGMNLTNELGITAQFMSMPAIYNRTNYQFVARPRTLGLEVRYQLK